MPKNPNVKRVMVIGSGPIVIGQAAEFDYAGTQACRSLKEEGVEVILVNSNPATIMTDKDIADKVYIEPLNVKVLEQIIEKEKPDSILPTLGGQAGLNLGMELEESGFLAAHNVKLLGTTAATIRNAEGRQEFKDLMERIGEPCAASRVVENVEDGVEFTNTIGYPVVLRPAYTLGGSGGGIAHNQVELEEYIGADYKLSMGELKDLAEKFQNNGIKTVAISMGKGGAMIVKDKFAARCPALSVKAHSTVGAGDAMVAALAYSWDKKLGDEETVRLCMATSAGAVTTVGTKPPARAVVDELIPQVEMEIL